MKKIKYLSYHVDFECFNILLNNNDLYYITLDKKIYFYPKWGNREDNDFEKWWTDGEYEKTKAFLLKNIKLNKKIFQLLISRDLDNIKLGKELFFQIYNKDGSQKQDNKKNK